MTANRRRRQPIVHGTPAGYSHDRCRCDACRDAHTAEAQRRRRGLAYGTWQPYIDSIGTVRRVRALVCAGYTCADIAAARGVHVTVVKDITRQKHQKINTKSAQVWAATYDDLCNEDGPSPKTAARARTKGWHGPEAWTDGTIDDPDAGPLSGQFVDDVLVQRAIGRNPAAVAQLNHAERVEATRRLLRRGVTVGAITGRLSVSGRTARKLVAAALEDVAA